MTEYERDKLLESLRVTLSELLYAAQSSPSRPLSLAITKVQEAGHWLNDASIVTGDEPKQS